MRLATTRNSKNINNQVYSDVNFALQLSPSCNGHMCLQVLFVAGRHFMAEPDMPSPYIRISYSLATPVMLDQVGSQIVESS